KVRELLKERLATLKEIAAQAEQAFRQNASSREEVMRARLQVHQAELDLCDSDAERIRVHEEIVAVAKEIEALINASQQEGVASSGVMLRARVQRLDAEIALERAKAKAAAGAK